MTSTLLTGISELWTLDPALEDPQAPPTGTADGQVQSEAAEGGIAPSATGAVAPLRGPALSPR